MNWNNDLVYFISNDFHFFLIKNLLSNLVMSKLETAIVALVDVFAEYAGTDDDKRKLSNAELSALIKDQLSSSGFKVRKTARSV